MFLSRQRLISLLLVVTLPFCVVSDDQAAENNYNDYNENGDGYNDWKKQYLYDAQSVDDSINYWTSFHIRAKRCVVYKNKDVIVFELFGGGNQCMDNQQLVGTYYTPVPYYMEGYLNEVQQKMEDRGVDDYVEPDVAQYQYCTPKEVNGEVLYLQLGCEDDTTRAIAVNVYSDNTCETRAPNNNGIDDANMDVTDIEIPFQKCQSCVNWVNKEDNQIDDQFYEKRQMLAPLCSTAWSYKEKCGRRCQRVGLKDEQEGWEQPDIVLLSVLVAFGVVVAGIIWHRHQNVPNTKDALLGEAAMNGAGLQTLHVVAVAGVIVLMIAGFALLGMKNVTFSLLLIIDIIMFGFLMKLTYDLSVDETFIGPDGQIMQKTDSEDSDEGSKESNVQSGNNGTYMLPTIT